MTARLFVVKDEDWFDISPKTGALATLTCATIRPYRRRSWTEAALRAAWAFLMSQPDPTAFRIAGSNAMTLATRLELMRPSATTGETTE